MPQNKTIGNHHVRNNNMLKYKLKSFEVDILNNILLYIIKLSSRLHLFIHYLCIILVI